MALRDTIAEIRRRRTFSVLDTIKPGQHTRITEEKKIPTLEPGPHTIVPEKKKGVVIPAIKEFPSKIIHFMPK